MTEVRELVWTTLSADSLFSDIFTLNTVGVMTQELNSLFLAQKSNQSVCSCCNSAISNKTSSFVVYITSLNLFQNKFEDSISAVILRKRIIVKKSSPKNLSADCRSSVDRQVTDSLPTG